MKGVVFETGEGVVQQGDAVVIPMIINILRCRKIVLSTLNLCTDITHAGTTIDESLQSTQEEADKVILHCLNKLSSLPTSMVTLRCHSGDTDIFILAVALLNCFRDRVV